MQETNRCEECVPRYVKREWWILVEETPKHLRLSVDDKWLVNSKHTRIVNESGRLPVYFFPFDEVETSFLKKTDRHFYTEHKGMADVYDIDIDGHIIEDAAWSYPEPEEESVDLKGLVSFVWNKIDHWYEEDEEIFVHPRDPYTRIDTLPSSRHIEVFLNGKKVADSKRPVILIERGLTPRYYIPIEDIDQEFFTPSDRVTRCPYKGKATYLSANVGGKQYDDIVWSYPDPVPEVIKIKGLYSFYNENVDELLVDGEKWELRKEDRLPYGGPRTDFVI